LALYRHKPAIGSVQFTPSQLIPWSRFRLQIQTIVQPVKKFYALYGT